MEITGITAGRDSIFVHTDADGRVCLRESVPTVGPKPGRTLRMLACEAVNGEISVPRKHDTGRDGIFSRFDVIDGVQFAGGVHYVTDIAKDVPCDDSVYPRPDIIKMLGLPPEMSKRYGPDDGGSR